MVQINSTVPPVPPEIPSGDEVYAKIIGEIEPDLLKENIPLLKEKYKNETKEEHAVRSERYRVAWEKYDKAFELFQQQQKEALDRYRKQLFQFVEREAQVKEEADMNSLELNFAA